MYLISITPLKIFYDAYILVSDNHHGFNVKVLHIYS